MSSGVIACGIGNRLCRALPFRQIQRKDSAMRFRLVTVMTWNLPVPTTWMSPDLGTYPVDGDCPVWQQKMRDMHGHPATVQRVKVASYTGRLTCFERECTGVH